MRIYLYMTSVSDEVNSESATERVDVIAYENVYV